MKHTQTVSLILQIYRQRIVSLSLSSLKIRYETLKENYDQNIRAEKNPHVINVGKYNTKHIHFFTAENTFLNRTLSLNGECRLMRVSFRRSLNLRTESHCQLSAEQVLGDWTARLN